MTAATMAGGHDRRALLARAVRLSAFTIAFNGIAGAAAVVAAVLADSPALAAFALNALLDSSASVVLVWRFRREQRDPAGAERLERKAHGWIALAMLIVGAYVTFEALRALVTASHAEESLFGVGLAAVSLAILPWLARLKLSVASQLGSGALRGDGILTAAAGALAAITLVALLANSAFDWWWADPAAALVIGLALAIEAARVTVRHRFG